ncbi:adenosylhomocysteinase [Streptomyces alfalfae]|uniref:Adenosylhomocysteinase n=1 Tax=Streptomyces alfalfae TaxID=1642299 RepID=A0A7T4PLN4_9ACTN|nr:adenosylhomocysteinase [Streptomyces alfalfae]QQC92383.1 adenosylhomocysteinase [Streptomyces alfalfae]
MGSSSPPPGKLVAAWMRMPLMSREQEECARERFLAGWRVALTTHMIATSVGLPLALRDAGASVVACASSPASTDDDIVDWLNLQPHIRAFGTSSSTEEEGERNRLEALDTRPHLIVDEADILLGLLYNTRPEHIPVVRGASVRTLTGVQRMRSMADRGRLRFPTMAVDNSPIKQIFDNEVGTGQSTVDALMRTANFSFPGSCVVVAGYGLCGRGVAARARGLGADVVVTEVDPLRALQAHMAGYRVMPMAEASLRGDAFITATGTVRVIRRDDIHRMKDGVFLLNAGHSSQEIDTEALEKNAESGTELVPHVTAYRMSDQKLRYLLAGGSPLNTSAGAGHPPELMDISFAAQMAGIRYLVRNQGGLEAAVHDLPMDAQKELARRKLELSDVRIDDSTAEQRRYTQQLSGESDEVFDLTRRIP